MAKAKKSSKNTLTSHKKSGGKKNFPARASAEKLQIPSWVESFSWGQEVKRKGELHGQVYLLGLEDQSVFESLLEEHSLSWQAAALRKNEKDVLHFVGQDGPVWILRPKTKTSVGHEGLIDEAAYSWARDQFGALVGSFKSMGLQTLQINFHGTIEGQDFGALVGLELASYQFRSYLEGKSTKDLPQVAVLKSLGDLDGDLQKRAVLRARAVNRARHLVNMPPNELNPTTFAALAQRAASAKNLKVTVWNTKKLQQEGMNLHLAVGQGSPDTACLVHFRYRPTKKSSVKPIAFVGKGITFDTGGVDIKPSSGMRLMKKDMGGAAAVTALALWAAESQHPAPLDFYLALAENTVDGKAFRPSDVIEARNGLKVEIDNTDAEGRLVLADVLDVACEPKGADEPEYVIDVATLTGAIKVGLGAEIAGLFANDDELAYELTKAGQRSGDLNWRMPLFDKYFNDLSSPFADFKNSGGGFGGAITAALFLQKFIGTKKWAHLDVYAWNDRGQGALTSVGGSGQPVQCLIEFLEAQRG